MPCISYFSFLQNFSDQVRLFGIALEIGLKENLFQRQPNLGLNEALESSIKLALNRTSLFEINSFPITA